MGLFDKLFGKKNTPPSPAAPPPASSDTEQGQELITVFDQFGRELRIKRSDWVKSVLLPNIEKSAADPEALSNLIVAGLRDGFDAELLNAAKRLLTIDTSPERASVLLAIVHMRMKHIDDAERVLRTCIEQHGESAPLLVNLAKVHAERNQRDLQMSTLWRSLELDPNQDNAVEWWMAEHRQTDNDEGQAALRKVATLPHSWRAQLWLARAALENRSLDDAVQLYQEALANAPRPVPTPLLMQMSGDLGKQGHLPQLIDLTAPLFIPEEHGIAVGNNLIKGYVDLGLFDDARALVDRLYAFKRPDWRENLGFWDGEIAKARLQIESPPQADKLQLTLLTTTGPIWLRDDSPAVELFPAREGDGPSVCFLCGSVERPTNSQRIEHQLSDASGRMSRALPLFFAEQLHWHTNARVATLVPWVQGNPGGFVVAGQPWDDEQVAHAARSQDPPLDYAVTLHLSTQHEPWQLHMRLIRTIDGTSLGTLSGNFVLNHPESGVRALAQKLITFLRAETTAHSQAVPADYVVPAGKPFPFYLLRLEQLLAVRCAGIDGIRGGFLSGEREILEGDLQLCLEQPAAVSVRIIFAQTMLAMKRVRPDVVAEFKDKALLLQSKHPLPGAAQGVIDRLFNDSFTP